MCSRYRYITCVADTGILHVLQIQVYYMYSRHMWNKCVCICNTCIGYTPVFYVRNICITGVYTVLHVCELHLYSNTPKYHTSYNHVAYLLVYLLDTWYESAMQLSCLIKCRNHQSLHRLDKVRESSIYAVSISVKTISHNGQYIGNMEQCNSRRAQDDITMITITLPVCQVGCQG